MPNYRFFGNDASPGLIDLFNRYKFTVEENTPAEREVALDPELLGRVFENLLASINPETQETARQATGLHSTTIRQSLWANRRSNIHLYPNN